MHKDVYTEKLNKNIHGIRNIMVYVCSDLIWNLGRFVLICFGDKSQATQGLELPV